MTERKSAREKTENKVASLLASMVLSHEGEPVWTKPWVFSGYDCSIEGVPYKGRNRVITQIARACFGYKSHVWLTFSKIRNLEGKRYDSSRKSWVKDDSAPKIHLKKGSKGIPCVHYNFYEKKENGEVVLDKNGKPVMICNLSSFYVYNADCIENFDSTPFEPSVNKSGIDILSCDRAAEALLSSYPNPPSVVYGMDQAAYSPDLDKVFMPAAEQFSTVPAFASTLAHELGHSTGHKSRLARKSLLEKGEHHYSMDELVAEFTSAMLLGEIGITSDEETKQSAEYLSYWMGRIGKDPKILYDAIGLAVRATDYVMGRTASVTEETEDDKAIA